MFCQLLFSFKWVMVNSRSKFGYYISLYWSCQRDLECNYKHYNYIHVYHKAKEPITLILWTKLAKALTVLFSILLTSNQPATNFVYLSVNSNNNRIPRAQIFTIFFKYTAFAQNFYKKNCSCENAMDYESILKN